MKLYNKMLIGSFLCISVFSLFPFNVSAQFPGSNQTPEINNQEILTQLENASSSEKTASDTAASIIS